MEIYCGILHVTFTLKSDIKRHQKNNIEIGNI